MSTEKNITEPTNSTSLPLWTWPFVVFVMLNFFVFIGFDTLLPTLPIFLASFGHSKAEIGLIYSVFTVSAVAMRILAAPLARRFAAFTLLRLGFLFCAFGGIFYYWASTILSGITARIIYGAGFGLISTLITALAVQIIPAHRLGEGMGYLGLGTTLALALGPFFGLWLMETWGAWPMFVVVSSFSVLAILLLLFAPKIQMPQAPASAPPPKLVLFSRKVWAPSMMMFLVGIAMSTTFIYMALFCQERSLPYAGHFFVLSTVGIFIARLFSGRIYDRLGHKVVLFPSGVLLLLSLMLIYYASSQSVLFIAAVIYGLATGAIFPAIQALALSTVSPTLRTEATASFFNALDCGIGAGSLLLGYVAGTFGTYASVYLAGAAATLVLIVFYWLYYFRPFK